MESMSRRWAWIGLALSWIGMVAQARTMHFYYTDPQGTVLAKTDAQGSILARYDYKPYGGVVSGQGPNGPGYTGHENDTETGLVYMQARYYDPVGRFLSPDPITPSPGALFGFNRYDYVENNPNTKIDPSGRHPEGDGFDEKTCEVYRCQVYFWSGARTKSFNKLPAVSGYSESGALSWRSDNDWAYIMAAKNYDDEHGLAAGDNGYMDAELLKAWSMVESGGNKHAFLTDPLQVNNPGDWDPAKKMIGLSRGQIMSSYESAISATKWWSYKGYVHNSSGGNVRWRGDFRAFERYNANGKMDKTIGGVVVPHYQWYANKVIGLYEGR